MPKKITWLYVYLSYHHLRVFYTILTKGVDYDAGKLMGDIRRPQIQAA